MNVVELLLAQIFFIVFMCTKNDYFVVICKCLVNNGGKSRKVEGCCNVSKRI